jgi:hypothetical protein
MEYVLLGVWCFLVALAGGPVGLVVGNLRLPVVLLVAAAGMGRSGGHVA